MHLLKFIEEGTGMELTFDDFDVLPLGYDALKALRSRGSGSARIPLVAVNARPLDKEGNPTGQPRVTVNAPIDTEFEVELRALLVGGWLPPGLAPHNAVLLLDACALSVIRGQFKNGKVLEKLRPDFLHMLEDRVARVSLLPLLLEGNKRGAPLALEDVEQIYDDAAAALARALPKAEIVGDRASVLRGAAGLIEEVGALRRKEVAFLHQVVKRLVSRAAASKLHALWDGVVQAAREHGLRLGSPPVLAALSALVALPADNVAQKLLKPSTDYTDADAHNALSDLNAIRFLLALHGDFPSEKPMLLTHDKNLALFWAGLGTRSAEREGEMLHYHLNPHPDLYPGEFGERLVRLVEAE